MTKLIKQHTGSDCVLACIAMAFGRSDVLDVFTQEDIDRVVAKNGTHVDTELEKQGLVADVDFIDRSVYSGTDQDTVKALLWGRRAILSVMSLNINNGQHAIYWDGEQIYDPSTLRTFEHLSTVLLKGYTIFKD